MTASVELLSVLVTIAVILTAIAPVVLLILLARDWKKGEQW